MKAVLLAAGKGTRLGYLTQNNPKPLLNVHGKPILLHNIELCKRYGIYEIYINTHHLADRIIDLLGDGSHFGVQIKYSFEPRLLGTAGALYNFKDDLGGDPFFVIYGDNLVDYDLESIYQFHQLKSGLATIVLYEKEEVSMSGIAVLDKNDQVLQFIEKPEMHQQISRLVNTGIYVLSPGILSYIKNQFADFGKDLFPKLIAEGKKIYGKVLKNDLICVDTPELYNRVMCQV